MIKVICVGKIKEEYLSKLISDYEKRISKYHKVDILELKDSDIKSEGDLILKNIKSSDFLVTMEIGGTNLSSLELSKNIDE